MIRIGTAADEVALFASDMHLGDHDAKTAARFFAAFDRHAAQATHLFLLGDLFEAWAGDDQPDAQAHALVARLRRCVEGGRQVFALRGNRDFLLDVALPGTTGSGGAFSARSGARVIEDPSTIELFGRKVLIAHGDALCTGDVEYQNARAIVRSAAWQRDFLARSLAERLAIARELRATSEHVQAARALAGGEPSDVDAEAVVAAMRAAGVRTMIHGHTHRPARHRLDIDGREAERWVLPDWHAGRTPASDRGGFVRVDRDGWHTIED